MNKHSSKKYESNMGDTQNYVVFEKSKKKD